MSEPKVRITKRDAIAAFFEENLNQRFRTSELHNKFGTAFRSRVSDINRSPKYHIRICNRTLSKDEAERSEYWAVERLENSPQQQQLLLPAEASTGAEAVN